MAEAKPWRMFTGERNRWSEGKPNRRGAHGIHGRVRIGCPRKTRRDAKGRENRIRGERRKRKIWGAGGGGGAAGVGPANVANGRELRRGAHGIHGRHGRVRMGCPRKTRRDAKIGDGEKEGRERLGGRIDGHTGCGRGAVKFSAEGTGGGLRGSTRDDYSSLETRSG